VLTIMKQEASGRIIRVQSPLSPEDDS
jgi:hypothetical protein